MRDGNLYNFWPAAAASCTYAMCVCTGMWETLCPVDKCRNIQQRNAGWQAVLPGENIGKRMFAQVQNCAITQPLRSARLSTFRRSFQFSQFCCFRFSILCSALATRNTHAVCTIFRLFLFLLFAHTPTRGVTRGQSLRQRHLEADLHSSSLSCFLINSAIFTGFNWAVFKNIFYLSVWNSSLNFSQCKALHNLVFLSIESRIDLHWFDYATQSNRYPFLFYIMLHISFSHTLAQKPNAFPCI